LSTSAWTAAGLAKPRPWRAALVDRLADRPSLTVSPATPADPDVAPLAHALTAELAAGGYTADQTFGYSLDMLASADVHLVSASCGAETIGIGGIELQADGVAELKRFYVKPNWRGSIAADSILDELLGQAQSYDVRAVRLETGNKQEAAMAFYRRHGFEVIPRFGVYIDSATSVSMQRMLRI
jgi:putative acetyltransferase